MIKKIKYISAIVIVAIYFISYGCGTREKNVDVEMRASSLVTESTNIIKNDKNAKVVKPLKKLIRLAKGDERYGQYLYKILDSGENYEKKNIAILVLASIKDNNIPDYLLKMLDRTDPKDRALSITYISKGKYKPATDKLKDMKENDPNAKIRFLAKLAYNRINKSISK